jgi:F-type H+-transporting ATPase subunit a
MTRNDYDYIYGGVMGRLAKTFFSFIIVVFTIFFFSPVPVHASSEEHGGELATPQQLLMHELVDKNEIVIPFIEKAIPLPQFEPVTVAGFTLNFSITSHFVFFWIGVFLATLFLLTYKRKKMVQTSLVAQLVETYVLFIRDDILKPSMPHHYRKFLPYFLTLFILIFAQNVLSLIPFMDHATKNISLTAPLAILSFLIVQFMGFKSHGPIGYMMTMMPISSKDMHPLAAFIINMMVFPFELLGQFTRPFALAIRLFANMVAGHAVILSFIMIAWFGDHWNYGAAAGGIFMAVFMYLLELLVAFLQAYVFTLLTAIFVGSAIESSH